MNKNKFKKEGLFWICGKHTVFQALCNPNRIIDKIVIFKGSKNEIDQGLLHKKNLKIQYENNSFFIKKFGSDFSHQGIAALIKPIIFTDIKKFSEIDNIHNVLALDGINDPRNIGSIIRSAVSYNWNNLLVNKKDFNDQSFYLFKSASGMMEHINLFVSSNIYNDIKYLKSKNFWIIGMNSKSNNSIYNYKNLEKKVIIFGSETKGIRNYLESFCDITYKLPISSKVDSLNVSCATSSTLAILDYKQKSPL